MECVERGRLRAFLDGELSGGDRSLLEQHVAGCAHCREALDVLRANALLAQSALGRLAPAVSEVPMPHWSLVRDRVERTNSRPVTSNWGLFTMFGNLLRFAGGPRVRMATGTAAVLIVAAMLFTMTPVQTLASNFLSIFRVQRFVAVQVDPSSLPKNLASPEELGSFKMVGDAKPKSVTLEAAEREIGFKMMVPASLPNGLLSDPKVTLFGAQTITYTPDLKKVSEYLASIGASNIKLPDNLDGAQISMQMPARVNLLYLERGGSMRSGDGAPAPQAGQKFLYVGATQSPTMTVPDGLDVEQLRTELMKFPNLPPDLVNQLKSISDWRNTMVVPVPKGTSSEVMVQGEKGLAVTDPDRLWSIVMWVKGGVIYAASGSYSVEEIVKVANSMK